MCCNMIERILLLNIYKPPTHNDPSPKSKSTSTIVSDRPNRAKLLYTMNQIIYPTLHIPHFFATSTLLLPGPNSCTALPSISNTGALPGTSCAPPLPGPKYPAPSISEYPTLFGSVR
jgi:hypothetical protein